MAKIKKRSAKASASSMGEFQTITETAAGYYRQYQKQANAVLAVLAAVLLIWAVTSLTKASNEKKAAQMFEAAYAAYHPVNGAPPNYPKALPLFQEIVKQYGGTVNGAAAQYYVGNTLANLGRAEDALKEYETFTRKYAGDTVLLGLVYQRMGYAYASLGKRDEAVKAFAQAEKLSGAGASTLELARLFESAGKNEDAQLKYKDVMEKLPGTTWAMEARSKVLPPDLTKPATPAIKAAPTGTARK